jgi:alkanesulfonate monooxygenase SsuD/methylene tetrahydromethanopterin reductase-like flavin-dependent oxidoreductase (luciferase family)
MHWDDVRGALYPDTAEQEDFSYERVERLLSLVRGKRVTIFSGQEGIEEWSDRVEPHSPGLADRLWYGGASRRSAEWAGTHGMNFLTSSVLKVDPGGFMRPDFATLQAEQIRAFRERHPEGRVSQGLVVIPTDSATADQKARYAAYAEARLPRTREPQGREQLLFSRDFVGSSEEIAEALHEHAGFQLVDEVAFALPFSFEPDDYAQLLTDMAERLGPALGWTSAQ